MSEYVDFSKGIIGDAICDRPSGSSRRTPVNISWSFKVFHS